LSELFLFDSKKREEFALICGIDEAGRGPLAGDVFATGVILPGNCCGTELVGLNDSKKLTPKKRALLYEQIKNIAVEVHVATATIEEIEQLNILGATMLAMKRVCERFALNKKCHFLIDGNRAPEISEGTLSENSSPTQGDKSATVGSTVEAIVKGDGVSACIAAASIIAKVERDLYMEKLALEYPQYGFEKHKGYGTALHYQMLREHGPTPVHRKSFL